MTTRLGRYLCQHHVALIALFVALGGTTYAATTINGSKLRSRSVSARKIKKDALTGAEINESKLGTVPSAAQADTASSADSAAEYSSYRQLDRL